MLDLPKTTELSKQLPKKAIYARFKMNTAAREKFDADISKITIVNEISPNTIPVSAGNEINSFYVLLISLKKKDFDEKTIVQLSNLIDQNILFILEYGNEAKLAIHRNRLMQTDWQPKDSQSVKLKGIDLDAVWDNITIQIGNIQIEEGNSLNEQITINEKRQKLQKEIDKLERLARNKKQPKKKI